MINSVVHVYTSNNNIKHSEIVPLNSLMYTLYIILEKLGEILMEHLQHIVWSFLHKHYEKIKTLSPLLKQYRWGTVGHYSFFCLSVLSPAVSPIKYYTTWLNIYLHEVLKGFWNTYPEFSYMTCCCCFV